jgi:class 3 adenylate cyclase/transcriptional regulator with XRE-family HTH domain/tetratricopeptide (TPR) repeat protein
MEEYSSFGYWLRRRRKALDLTQGELAQQVGCSEITIRKIEADERRPSRQIAERLTGVLGIAEEERAAFLKAARAELSPDRLQSPAPMPTPPGRVVEQHEPPNDAVAIATCAACGAPLSADQLFCGTCGMPRAANAPQQLRQSASPREERRWATVMFADLAGFTRLAARTDPEDVKAIVADFLNVAEQHITRYGGSIVHVLGDGVLAVFGVPQTHEDDAERAVRAALALRDSSFGGEFATQLKLHIGINTGEVLATTYALADRRDSTLLGDPVNTADRILRAALAGSVLVGEETYRATRHAVSYEELPPVVAKGKERPIRVWQAISITTVPETRPLGTGPLVGREKELGMLQASWERVVRESQPHLVLLLGEPGIGKSRLSAEFERWLPDDTLVLHGRCVPYGEVLGYGALALALKEAAGITADDAAETARARLGVLVEQALSSGGTDDDLSDYARHLALLSGLDVEADRASSMPDQRAMHVSVRRFLEALACLRPLCLIVEDIHWADDALLELLEFVASRAQAAPLLLLAQARWDLLEQRPAWARTIREFTSIRLEPLDQQRRYDLIAALCHRYQLSGAVVELISRPTGGNPLFIEEMVAMIAERGPVAAAGIPSMIKALLAARLDGLPPEQRSLLQLAAVFGKIFWAGGVRALGAASDTIELLDALEQKDFLRSIARSQIRGDQEYTFKHELLRDVAYEMLPRAERRVLHGRVVDWMEASLGERVEEHLDLLAHHAVEASQQERALDYLARAAERARHAAARQQEAALLARAIVIAERLGRRDLVASLHAQRGKAFADIGMWAAARPDLEAALQGLAPQRVAQRAQALADLALVCHWVLDVPSTRRYAAEALELAEGAGRDDLAAGALGAFAWADSSDGAIRDSLERFERAFERAGQPHASRLAPSLELSGLILYWLGRSDAAIVRGREALEIGRAAGDTSTTIRALGNLGLALTESGRYGEAQQVFDEARRFGREYGVGTGMARAIAMCGGLHLAIFDFAGAEALAEEARDLARSLNWFLPVISGGIDLLLNFARRQEPGRAEALVDEVAEGVQQGSGVHGWLWSMRFAQARAELALARGDWESTLRWANSAIERAQTHGRRKYQVLGLAAQAQALDRLGRTREAIADLRSAVELARPIGDPALFVRAGSALLALDGDDALAAEAHAAAEAMRAALPDDELRRRFSEAAPIKLLEGLRGL